jgi:hypothetical protein
VSTLELIDDGYEPTDEELQAAQAAVLELARLDAWHEIVVAIGPAEARALSEAEHEEAVERLVAGGYEIECEVVDEEYGPQMPYVVFKTDPLDALEAIRRVDQQIFAELRDLVRRERPRYRRARARQSRGRSVVSRRGRSPARSPGRRTDDDPEPEPGHVVARPSGGAR